LKVIHFVGIRICLVSRGFAFLESVT
jgi:hypothetical protein